MADVVARFEDDYRRIYGLTIPDVGIEVVTWRLSAYADADAVEPLATFGDAPGEPMRHPPGVRSREALAPSTRRSTAASNSASASGSPARRSSRSARRRRRDPAGVDGESSLTPTAR